MNKTVNYSIFLRSTAVLFLMVLLSSCDTEYIDKVNTIPGDVVQVPGYTQIESFTVKDLDNNAISAAIIDNSIIVTWSNHIALPETIKPEIVLGTEATVSPASGAEIPFKDGAVYTVTSKAGTTKQYTLKIDFRQKQPQTWTLNSGDTYFKGNLQKVTNLMRSGTEFIDDLWLSTKDTRVYLVAASDQKTEYTAEIAYLGSGSKAPYADYGVYFFLPDDIPVGLYDLRIKNGAYLLQNGSVENRFKIEVVEPDFFKVELSGSPAEKQIGETFEVRGGLIDTVTEVIMYNSANSAVTYPLEIVSLTPYRAVLKVPAGTPAGTYNRMRFIRGEASTLTAYTLTVK